MEKGKRMLSEVAVVDVAAVVGVGVATVAAAASWFPDMAVGAAGSRSHGKGDRHSGPRRRRRLRPSRC